MLSLRRRGYVWVRMRRSGTSGSSVCVSSDDVVRDCADGEWMSGGVCVCVRVSG